MSLTGKQVRELQSLYESVYAEKSEKEDVVLTQEEFDELCLVILQEAFESSGVEIFEGRKKLTLIQKGYRHIVKPAIDYMKKNKAQLATSAAAGGAGVGEITTGGTNIKHGGAMLNNLGSFVKDTRTMSNQNQQGAGMLMKDKETGTFSTAQQVRDKVKKKEKLDNSFEFDNFNLHIVEDAKSLEDLTKELNKQKNKKDNTNINTNIKDKTPETDVKDTPKKENKPPEKDTSNTDAFDYGTTEKGQKREQPSATVTQNIINKSEKDRKELERKELSEPDFDDPDRKIGRGGPMPKPVDKKETPKETPKEKPKRLTAREKMRRRNEIIHGKDHVKKLRDKNAAFQKAKNKKDPYTMNQFVQDFPKSQTAKRKALEKLGGPEAYESYEPYHIVLGYVLSEGHADTVEEAHYIMTQMDGETIQEIVALDEGVVANTARLAGALTLGGMGLNAIRNMSKNKEKMDKGGKFTPGSTLDNIQKKNEILKGM